MGVIVAVKSGTLRRALRVLRTWGVGKTATLLLGLRCSLLLCGRKLFFWPALSEHSQSTKENA
jgi:hypothetical protein